MSDIIKKLTDQSAKVLACDVSAALEIVKHQEREVIEFSSITLAEGKIVSRTAKFKLLDGTMLTITLTEKMENQANVPESYL